MNGAGAQYLRNEDFPQANLPQSVINENEINGNINAVLNPVVNHTENAAVNPYEDLKSNESTEILFILGESGGKLAVLSPDRQTVYEIFNVYINTLPDYDKNLLQNGIEIKTTQQLYSLLEDYNS